MTSILVFILLGGILYFITAEEKQTRKDWPDTGPRSQVNVSCMYMWKC